MSMAIKILVEYGLVTSERIKRTKSQRVNQELSRRLGSSRSV